AQTQLIVDRPVESALPGPNVSRPRVLGPAARRGEVQLPDDGLVRDERNQELRERLSYVLRAARERHVRELDLDRVAGGRVAARHAANTERRVVRHHGSIGRIRVDVASGTDLDDLRERFLAVAVAKRHRDRAGAPAVRVLAVRGHLPYALLDIDDALLVLSGNVAVRQRLRGRQEAVRLDRDAGLETGHPIDGLR